MCWPVIGLQWPQFTGQSLQPPLFTQKSVLGAHLWDCDGADVECEGLLKTQIKKKGEVVVWLSR